MRGLVIGLGETGNPLFEILQATHYETHGFDPDKGYKYLPMDIDVLHICIPFSDRFVDIVKDYQECTMPKYTVIHSTVPIGTTSKIHNAVHSPILGRHKRMVTDMKLYPKWIGGKTHKDVYSYFVASGFNTIMVDKPEETEALKLLCLARYGASIAMAHYCKDIADKYGFDYNDILIWDKFYNSGVDELHRPIIKLGEDKTIGGHCVIPNTRILNGQHPNQIWDEVLKYA